MRETNILESPDHYDGAALRRKDTAATMPFVEFSILDQSTKQHTSDNQSLSLSLSSSCTDSIDFLIEGIDVDDNYGAETMYSTREQEVEVSPYSCGKTFIIHKRSKDETLGIELGKANKYGGVFVTKIEETSKFAYTGLKPGMQILSINDRPCPVDFRTVAYIMKETVGDLKISAIDSTNKKNMVKAIQSRQAHRPQPTNQQQKQPKKKSSPQQPQTIKKEESFGSASVSARTWSPGTSYSGWNQRDQRESREESQGSARLEERCAPPSSSSSSSSSSKLLASPRALASGGARLVSHWMRSKRYHKIKSDDFLNRSSGRGNSRRSIRRYSSREERRIDAHDQDDDECSTNGLLERIPSALALDSIVQEELESNPADKGCFCCWDYQQHNG